MIKNIANLKKNFFKKTKLLLHAHKGRSTSRHHKYLVYSLTL